MNREEGGKFVQTVSRAVKLTAEGSFEESLTFLDAALVESKGDSRIAMLHYCRGQALDGLRRFADARKAFEAARDLDLLPMRAMRRLNDAVRAVADRPEVHIAEVEEAFARAVPDGIPDGRLFFDCCHPTMEGHQIIARTLLGVILAENVLEK